ncbi:hypothetical protein MRI28_11795 [Nocardiopsis dassonvillei]|uniref:hypothetical protein n=1 Tax=Nocardiopsis dassonvillei TaxID=2014 RepID=UPI00200CFF9B|nr:hypothetical protein [Nocardiopsis dassonvillei]MCK9870314.1 hypothetical protein [Nocardiopsis dassonvillei]
MALSHNPPIGAHRHPSPDEPRPRLSEFRPTAAEIDQLAQAEASLRLTLVGGDHDPDIRIFDRVFLRAEPIGPTLFLVHVQQQLRPSAAHGPRFMEVEYAGTFLSGEILNVEPELFQIPVQEQDSPPRRSYRSEEMFRYANFGAHMTLIRARPDHSLADGEVYRRVHLSMDAPNSGTVHITDPWKTGTGPIPVPLEEIGFALHVPTHIVELTGR